MAAPLLMTTLLLVQSGWVVDEVPLVTPPLEVMEAIAIDDRWVAVHAMSFGPPIDGGLPYAERPVLSNALLAVSTTQSVTLHTGKAVNFEISVGSGTGVTMTLQHDAGIELFRVRTEKEPELVSLGRFGAQPVVTCASGEQKCVVIDDLGLWLWTPEKRTSLWKPGPPIAPTALEEETGLVPPDVFPVGAALRPSGDIVALASANTASVMDLKTGRVTSLLGPLVATKPNLDAAIKSLRSQKPFTKLSDHCSAVPRGWNESRLVVTHQNPYAEIGSEECPFPDFEIDPITLKRKSIAAYPWKVLDCPDGGWSSKHGTFVTTCLDEITRMMRKTVVSKEEDNELPEAVGISETQIFVMAPPRDKKWKWYRGAPKGKALEFTLNGPSLLTFGPKGVVVEPVPSWRFGKAEFIAPLEDDWHLISSTVGWALVRIRQD